MEYQFSFEAILSNWELLAKGAVLTVTLTVIGSTIGIALGTVGAVSRAWSLPMLSKGFTVYIECIRNTPFLVQLYFIFLGLPALGVKLNGWEASVLAMVINLGAYSAEIIRAGIMSIPKGLLEAAESLAMNRWQQVRYVILPQAIRISLPATVGFSVQVVKGTAVTSIIGFLEITKTGTMIANATFKPLLVYGLVALGYFLICFPLSAYARRVERGMHVTHSR